MMKAIFKDYEADRIGDRIYCTFTSFEVVSDNKITTKGARAFVRRHLNSSDVSLKVDKAYYFLRSYVYVYHIMINGKTIGYVNFVGGHKSFLLTYNNKMHDAGLNYGDYELSA